MAEKTLEDLMLHALKDINFAEHMILKALPSMIDGAKDAGLKTALKGHMKETEGHIERIEEAFSTLGKKPESVTCEAIKGILKEGTELLEDFGGTRVGDAAIIFACQAVEHYEINRYGTLHAWALDLDNKPLAAIFEATLKEEYAADDKLTELAEGGLNQSAESKSARSKMRKRA
jgi:ferritin-like metal-binding protein YciE